MGIVITVFDSKGDRDMAEAQIKTVYATTLKAFGASKIYYVMAGKDSRVWVSLSGNPPKNDQLSPEQQAILESVANALGGRVTSIGV